MAILSQLWQLNFRSPLRRLLVIAAFAIVAAASATLPLAPAIGAVYPEKPIRLVVPFAPGGGSDVVARLVAQKMGQSMERTVIVENIGGAGGAIGAEQVARAAPDGYTLLLGTESTHGTNAASMKLKYDPIKDFIPVSLLATAPSLLVAHPSVPVKSAAELIAYAKANPNKLNFGSWGSGSSTHLALEHFKAMSRTEIAHIPFKGGAPGMTALVAGEIDVSLQGSTLTMPYLKAGRVKVLAVANRNRVALLPNVPTISESGLPGFDIGIWFAIFAPAGTPQPIVERLQQEIRKALAQPDLREKVGALGMETAASTPDELRKVVVSEVERWKTLVRDRNLKFE